MYRPPAFDEPDVAVLHELVRSSGAAHLVTLRSGPGGGLEATTLPLLLDTGPADGPLGTLRGHVARPNPQWREVSDTTEALAIFAGPDGYVSPAWYPSKRANGKVVPTWNYVVVHAHGRLTVHDDAAWVRDFVTRLTERHESGRADPWAVTDAPERYVAAMVKGIVGLELRITRLEGKRKLSQNRPAEDAAGVIDALSAGTDRDRAVADAMRKVVLAAPEPEAEPDPAAGVSG